MTPLEFANSLLAAFASSQSGPYFDHFSPDATFIFHNAPGRLETRDAYEQLWSQWEKDDDFQILSCESSNQRVQDFADVALFTHDVRTVSSVSGEQKTILERETIVLHRTELGWIAVHEHLSVDPRS